MNEKKICETCKAEYDKNLDRCPVCSQKDLSTIERDDSKKMSSPILVTILILIAIIIIFWGFMMIMFSSMCDEILDTTFEFMK